MTAEHGVVRYTVGAGTALVGARTWALVRAPGDGDLVHALWPAIVSGAPLADLVEILVGHGIASLPDLALVAAAGERVHVLLRGDVDARTSGGDSVSAFGVTTWTEHVLAAGTDAVAIALHGCAGGATLPASVGVVLADRLEIPLSGAAVEAVALAPVPPLEQAQVDFAQARSVLARSVQDLQAPAADVEARSHDTEPFDDVVARAAPGPEEEGVPDYQHLFEATTNREAMADRVAFAPPPTAAQPAAPADAAPPNAAPAVPTVADAVVVAAPAPPQAGSRGAATALIDGVPWETGPRVDGGAARRMRDAADAPAADAGELSVPTEETVQRPPRRDPAPAPDRIGPMVHAVHCLSGHPNAPQNLACRECGAPLAEQDAISIPRPVLGVLRLSTGDVVTLDRDVVLGRSPHVAEGGHRPHVVKVNNPSGEVSRNHVAVRLDGWHVVVQDLRSTNGTVLKMPGEEPRRLRPDEQVLVPENTEVRLADGVWFRYEVAP